MMTAETNASRASVRGLRMILGELTTSLVHICPAGPVASMRYSTRDAGTAGVLTPRASGSKGSINLNGA